MSDRIQDKFDELKIEAEMQISLISGLVKLSGSGAYFNENKKSARTQSMALVYRSRTITEQFMLRHHTSKVDVEILKDDNGLQATHVVVGIDWGAVCSITCQCENSEERDETVIQGALSGHLKELQALVSAGGSVGVDYKDTKREQLNRFTYKCTSDVAATDKQLPTSFEDALEVARSFPIIVKQTNNGKGVPSSYRLMSLENVAKICKIQVTLHLHYSSIKEDTIKRTAQVMESIIKKRQKLFDIQNDLHTMEDYVKESSLSTIDKYMDNITLDESEFKHQLQELVTKIRCKEADVSSLDQFLSDGIGGHTWAKYDKYIRQFQAEIKMVNLIKNWKKRGIDYLGKKSEFIVDDANTLYVLFKPKCNADGARSQENENFFLRCQKTYSQQRETIFKVVDENIRPDLWGNRLSKANIEEYKNGRKISHDFYEKEGKSTQMCLVKHQTAHSRRPKPNERAVVKIECPNSIGGTRECSGAVKTWQCAKCKELVEYGLKTRKFHCRCGKSDPSKSLFRCNENVHGIDYIAYPENILLDALGHLRTMEEQNILILGETGVGKSTWINGVFNYIFFSELKEARKLDDLLFLIPSQFIHTKGSESIQINIGEVSDSEVLKAGYSKTKMTTPYIFDVGNKKIRIIDTPGIGDSRRLGQDQENLDNILSFLSYYDEIHAICILLKSNNSRLNAMFQFCIQELLERLHTSLKENIVFCFTNTRNTFHRPGDTLTILNSMLREKKIGITASPNNFFCFDNEPLRFLACQRNGIDFNNKEIKTYAKIWKRNAAETKKMFAYIKKTPPHKVGNTISMNEARRVVAAISKLMVDVVETIEDRKKEEKNAMDQINLHAQSLSSLEKNLKFTYVDLERIELDHPVTVCAHSDCIKKITVRGDNTPTENYNQICDDNCTICCIPTETKNNWKLKFCSCIDLLGVTCQKCGHHYTDHMHVTYNLRKVQKEGISDHVQKMIMDKKTEQKQAEDFKRQNDIELKELEHERETILQASAKYGAFVNENALIPYNDVTGDYLDMVIKQEKDKDESTRSNPLLQQVKELRNKYEKEKEILDNAIKDGISTTAEELLLLRQELFELKYFGKKLKKIFDGILISASSRHEQFREIQVPIHQCPDRSKKKWSSFWKSS